jgi:hypothetical protein
MVVTIRATTGDVVKIEKLDKAGKRDELSEEECARLAGADEHEEIEAALEAAFEAGIAGALSEDDEDSGLLSSALRPAFRRRGRRATGSRT